MRPFSFRGLVNLGCIAVLLLVWIALASRVHAEPVTLTKAQTHMIERVNQDVNWRFAHFGSNGRGLCWWLAAQKRSMLVDAGIPAAALTDREVMAWGRELHIILTVDAVVDGKPWRRSLDMNSPWLEDDRQVRAMGYADVN